MIADEIRNYLYITNIEQPIIVGVTGNEQNINLKNAFS